MTVTPLISVRAATRMLRPVHAHLLVCAVLSAVGAALDPENEAAVSHAIAALTSDPDRTVIVIAHRPATLAAADHVVALDAGWVTEVGTPAELRESGGTFAHLYHQYEHARSWRITTASR